MKLEKTAAISEIVSSIAIVLTLIYLAIQTQQLTVQTQQTNAALLANSRQATLAADLQMLTTSIENPEIVVATTTNGWSAEDAKIGAYVAGTLRIREFAWSQYQDGILDERTWNSYMTPVVSTLGSEFGQSYWSDNQSFFDPAFVEHVNERIGYERP